MNYYDTQLLEHLNQEVGQDSYEIIFPFNNYLSLINQVFPTIHGRIDVEKLSNYHHKQSNTFSLFNDCVALIESLNNKELLKLDSLISYIGDSLLDNIYLFHGSLLIKILKYALDEIPQAHYFFNKGLNWCLRISFNNEIEFGILG